MATYTAYGLTIQSPFEFPELPTTGAGDPDVVIQRADLDPVPAAADNPTTPRAQSSPGQYRLTFDSYGTFLVEDGERIHFDPDADDSVGTKATRRLLSHEMLGVVLHQRGRLVLHASAISVGGRAAIFLGPRGAGKSTTAAAFHVSGHTLLEDDIVSVRFDGDSLLVDPGVPETRLHADAVDALGIDEVSTYATDVGPDKRYHEFGATPGPAPLRKIYVLQEGEAVTLEEIPPRNRLLTLVARTYAQGLLSETETTGDHFEQCSTVVEAVPMQRLVRTDEFDSLATLVETVEADLRSVESSEE